MVADALGFPRIQNNVLYVNNSRGKIESVILDALDQVMITLSKLAEDLIMSTYRENEIIRDEIKRQARFYHEVFSRILEFLHEKL